MPQNAIDLRSDTVTKPTPEMRSAMAQAVVGDDVFGEGPIFGEDPTVNELQQTIADMLGKETALFVPSGTMSNQIGLRVHCRPGDEFICEAGCHIFNYEQGGYAQLSGLCGRPLEGQFGVLRLEQFASGLIRADNEHLVRTRLVCLENTHNRGGGRVQPLETVESICDWAHKNGLATHLDGARLFNAVVASGVPAREWARHFDTVSVCFSKGLGAPVGSALCGPRELIAQARRHRKLFGGGMRQVGIIAAGALHALRHHIDRLAEDHANAQLLGAAIREQDGLTLRPDEIDTNIVIFAVDPTLGSAGHFVSRLAERGVKMIAFGPVLIRACTHLDVTRQDIERACEILAEVVQECSAGQHRPSKLDSAYV
jgi:threonine aldolase